MWGHDRAPAGQPNWPATRALRRICKRVLNLTSYYTALCALLQKRHASHLTPCKNLSLQRHPLCTCARRRGSPTTYGGYVEQPSGASVRPRVQLSSMAKHARMAAVGSLTVHYRGLVSTIGKIVRWRDCFSSLRYYRGGRDSR